MLLVINTFTLRGGTRSFPMKVLMDLLWQDGPGAGREFPADSGVPSVKEKADLTR